VIGFYRGKDLHYATRVRAGFVPATRRETFDAIKHLETAKCSFVNLPEEEEGRWGQGLTAEKMKECVWLLCRIRHSSHNVECQTMPHRVLPVLSLLRPASPCFGIIRLSMRHPIVPVCSRQ
jgi:hypothetical protein